MTGDRGARFALAAGGLVWLALAGAATTARAQTTYPSSFQITDRDAPGQIQIRLQDYAVAPNTAIAPGSTDKTAGQVARINFVRQDPTNTGRFVVPDLNGDLYTLNKTTRAFSSYVNFLPIFPNFDRNPGFAAGLVTVEFDPAFLDAASPGYGTFYTTHTEVTPGGDPEDDNFRVGVLTRWKVPGNPLQNFGNAAAQPAHTEMLRVSYASNIHPLGDITFNPNATPGNADYRKMYISSGDGGSGESSGSTRNRPQLLGNMAGKILRIQPDDPDGAGPLKYGIPSDNPFVNQVANGGFGEVWALGLRNPHRLAWDAPTGKLIVNDIGLHSYEEVNVVRKGANYGYSRIEGSQLLISSEDSDNNEVSDTAPPPASLPLYTVNTSTSYGNLTPTYPVAQFSHRDGDAISSGFVYRGSKIPALVGKYVFGDIANGRLFYVDYSALQAQDLENNGFGFRTTMPPTYELKVMYEGSAIRVFDLVRDTFDLRNETPEGSTAFNGVNDDDRLPGSAASTNRNDPYGVAYRQPGDSQGGRADIRWAVGPDNELYLISKSDGMLRALMHPGDYTGVRGDFNFDGQFTNTDIQAMLDALQNLTAFKSAHTLVDADLLAMGDFSGNSAFNTGDIQPLLQALASPGGTQGVPEPSAFALAAIGLASIAVRCGRRGRLRYFRRNEKPM